MRQIHSVLVILGVCFPVPPALSATESPSYDVELVVVLESLKGRSLDRDPGEDRLETREVGVELAIDYPVSERVDLFFRGAIIDESETVERAGRKVQVSGFERQRTGLTYAFGDDLPSELTVGRMAFDSPSDWWVWWDEELDAIRLRTQYGNLSAMVALAEEQARASTGVDFIDPAFDGVKRTLLSLDWEPTSGQRLALYYLGQKDGSSSYVLGEIEDDAMIDAEDADLTWAGLSYFTRFGTDTIGDIELALHLARVRGDETTYGFDDLSGGRSEVTEIARNHVSGDAWGLRFRWKPASSSDWNVVLGGARGSGDGDPEDDQVNAYRQTGLQGDTVSYGALYQPELSNLEVGLLGIEWRPSEGIDIALLGYLYKQHRLATEMRDVVLENDLTGTSRDLGREIDLVVSIDPLKDLEIVLKAARFEPGAAYGANAGETAGYLGFELIYTF